MREEEGGRKKKGRGQPSLALRHPPNACSSRKGGREEGRGREKLGRVFLSSSSTSDMGKISILNTRCSSGIQQAVLVT